MAIPAKATLTITMLTMALLTLATLTMSLLMMAMLTMAMFTMTGAAGRPAEGIAAAAQAREEGTVPHLLARRGECG